MIYILLCMIILLASGESSPAKSNTTVCYDYIGCFNNNFPFNNTELYLPEDPETIKTKFSLFTDEDPLFEQDLNYKEIRTIKNSKFNKNLPLKVIVHGYGEDQELEWLLKMKDTLLKVTISKFFKTITLQCFNS